MVFTCFKGIKTCLWVKSYDLFFMLEMGNRDLDEVVIIYTLHDFRNTTQNTKLGQANPCYKNMDLFVVSTL